MDVLDTNEDVDVVENAVEEEDLSFPEFEEKASADDASINIDLNSRVVTASKSSPRVQSDDSCTTVFKAGGVDFSEASKLDDGAASCSEELELSDEEEMPPSCLYVKLVDSHCFVNSENPLEDADIPLNSDQVNNDVEYVSESKIGDDLDSPENFVETDIGTRRRKGAGKFFDVYKALMAQKEQKIVRSAVQKMRRGMISKFSDKKPLINEDEVFVAANDIPLQGQADSSIMEPEDDTDTEELLMDSDLTTKGINIGNVKTSTTIGEDKNRQGRKKNIGQRRKKTEQGMNNLDVPDSHGNDLTEEEDLYDDNFPTKFPSVGLCPGKQEWTEVDESGSVKQVTQIKTETSIKFGDEGETGDDDIVSRTTTTTTTRIVTTVTTDDDEEEEREPQVGLHSNMDDIINQFMSDGGTASHEPSTQQH